MNNSVVQVEVQKRTGCVFMSRTSFLQLKPKVRNELILDKKVKFTNSKGEVIPLVEAVKDLLQ